MKLLLTSAGVKNASIHDALVGMLGKPVSEASALLVPTALYGMGSRGLDQAWKAVTSQDSCPMAELGWKSVGLLELTALPSIGPEAWVPRLRETDALLVTGGDPLYLHHWMRQSGLADLLPTLEDTVYVGFSAGSMVLTPRIGEDFVGWRPADGADDTTLGLVDFSLFPHLDCPGMLENTTAYAERWAASLDGPSYAIDDETAVAVVDGTVAVVSEGHWKHFGH